MCQVTLFFNRFFVPLCCTSSGRFQSFMLGSPDLATALQTRPSAFNSLFTTLCERSTVHNFSTKVAQDAVSQLCHQGALLAYVLLVNQDIPPPPIHHQLGVLWSCFSELVHPQLPSSWSSPAAGLCISI